MSKAAVRAYRVHALGLNRSVGAIVSTVGTNIEHIFLMMREPTCTVYSDGVEPVNAIRREDGSPRSVG